MGSDADLAEVRPRTIRELDGMPLVGRAETVAVRTIRAERKPERGVARTFMDIGFNLRPTSLAVGENPMETVGKHLRAVGAKNDDGRKERTVGEGLNVLVDDVVVDGRTDLGACIGHETVEREDLPGNTGRRLGRKPRERIRSNSGHEEGRLTRAGRFRWERPATAPTLARATEKGIHQDVEVLLEANADPNASDPRTGTRPLAMCFDLVGDASRAETIGPRMIRTLLGAGADPNAWSGREGGHRPRALVAAIEAGADWAVAPLREAGADVDEARTWMRRYGLRTHGRRPEGTIRALVRMLD